MAVKTKLNREQESNILATLHNNSRRTSHILHKGNPCIMQCWYPNEGLEIPHFDGPVFQLVYNGGKRSPFMNMDDAGKLLALVKHVRSHDVKMFPGFEGTHELKCGRVSLRWDRISFSDTRSPRYVVGGGWSDISDEFITSLMGSLIRFIAGGKGADEYPVSIVSHYADHINTDEIFALTNYGQNRINTKPSWLRYQASRVSGCYHLELSYGESQFHIQDKFIKGVDWEIFVTQLADAAIKILDGEEDEILVFKNHPLLSKYRFCVRKYVEGEITYMIFNNDLNLYNNKTMFAMTDENTPHLRQFLTTILHYHR